MSSMNQAEPSIDTSYTNCSATSESYLYSSAWVDTISKSADCDLPSADERSNAGQDKTDQVKFGVPNRGEGIERLEVKRNGRDFGFWLLRGSVARLNGWALLETASWNETEEDVGTPKWGPDLVKRYYDIAGSLFLSILFSPLVALIIALIKLDSPGPVFFRHFRVGKDGNKFVLWKFRSMRADAPRYESSPATPTDERLTRIGRLIRRLSLDEMPQLINVLKGDMSLVGPRPEMPFIVENYGARERKRLTVKPGITGLWQISQARAFPIHENLEYDFYYIRHRNLFLDCAILVRTIAAAIRGVGAI